jgi:uncharacterized protein DUF6677
MAGKAVAEGSAAEKAKIPSGHPSTLALVRLCVAAWLIPGLGHLLVGKRWRALILFASIMIMFVLGLAMQGQFFLASSASYLEVLGHYGELCVGLAMPTAKFFGYGGGDPFFVSSDFGTAYLVAAGMLNVLAVLDCFDIAMRRKA